VTAPTAAQFLARCRPELGYTERPVNLTKYAAMAGHPNGNAWCITFLVAMAKATGLKLPYYGAYSPAMAQAFKNAGRYGTTPRVGAFGFVYHPELGRIAHGFVVESLLPDRYTIGINGNSNSGGSRTGGMVCRVKRSPYRITYGYPNYALTSVSHTNPWPVPVLTTARPYIGQETKKTSAEVKYVQWAAMGPAHDDGVWGPATEEGVRDFQTAHGLKRDGNVGPQTLNVMKTVRR